jgi:hypothetical protein
MVNRKVTCKITGKSFTFNKDYFTSKIEEYQTESNLRELFITKKAKSLLIRGYNVQEIRSLLEIEDSGLLAPEHPDIKRVVDFHQAANLKNSKKKNLNFANHKSDPLVVELINNIKKQIQ